MNYLITGGTGFIGNALIAALPTDSTVTVLTRQASLKSSNPKINYVNSLEAVNKVPNVVINLAGEPIFGRWSERKKQRIINSRVKATEALSEFLNARAPNATLVSASAVGYYPHSSKQAPTALSASASASFAGHLCHSWEQAAKLFRGTAHIARLGIVLGKGGYLQQLILPTQLGLAMHLGSGQQGVPWVHIDDVVKGILALAQATNESSPLVLVAPSQNSHAEINNTLAAQLNRKVRLSVPSSLIKLTGGEMASELILNGHYFNTSQLANQLIDFNFSKLNAAVEDILST